MKKQLLLLLVIVLAIAPARAQTLVEGKNPTGAAASANPVVVGGVGSTGQIVRLKVNDDGTLTIGGVEIGDVVVSQAGAAHEANSQVTATTTAGTLIIARPTRRSALLTNLASNTTNVCIGGATVTCSNAGIILTPGQSVPVTAITLLQVIAASGTPVVTVFDEYD